MKTKSMLFMALCTMFIVSCKNNKKATNNENPFFSDYQTAFKVPPFDKIDTSHYAPAFKEGVKRHLAEIDSIITNPAPANFENTILAFDKSGKLLTKVSNVFFNMTGVITNEKMQAIEMELSPLAAKHADDISMNGKLFQRIKTVYDQRAGAHLDSQQLRVVEKYYRDFVRNGANLPKEKQEQLRKINEELSTLAVQFSKNQLAEINKNFKLVIEDKKDLDGLPENTIKAAAESAKEKKLEGKWVFTLDKPSLIPFLQYAKNRELREKIYRAYFSRGNHNDAFDNKKIISRMAVLRVQKANLLGYPSYAAYVIDDNMAKTPQKVDEFLMKLWKASIPVAKKEVQEMQKFIDKEGGKFKLQSWDWWYYAEKVRKEKYDLDENEIKPYLSLNQVREGMFMVAGKLYGISFTKINNVPVYHKDAEVYEVKEADGKHLAILYLDYYPRESKRGGAWCTSFRAAGWENGKKVDPIISIVCNFTKPMGDTPSLLTWDETETLFHEFGHALHFMFSDGKYNRTAGNVPQDYVEMPSQFMENWAAEPTVLKSFAKHFKTGEVIPDKLIEKISNSGHFNQGFATVEYIAASLLDLAYHNLSDTNSLDIEKFEKTILDKIGLIPEILPRYRSTYFSHIWDGGYSAGYYVYLWAAVLDADAFNAFKTAKGDLFNKELAAKFRKYCLQESGDDEGMTQYKKFRGQDASIEPLLKKRGLN